VLHENDCLLSYVIVLFEQLCDIYLMTKPTCNFFHRLITYNFFQINNNFGKSIIFDI